MKGWIPLYSAITAGLVALAGYLVNQHSLRQERKAKIFTEAILSVKEFEELPYRVTKRAGTNPETIERLGNLVNDAFVKMSYFKHGCALQHRRYPAHTITIHAEQPGSAKLKYYRHGQSRPFMNRAEGAMRATSTTTEPKKNSIYA